MQAFASVLHFFRFCALIICIPTIRLHFVAASQGAASTWVRSIAQSGVDTLSLNALTRSALHGTHKSDFYVTARASSDTAATLFRFDGDGELQWHAVLQNNDSISSCQFNGAAEASNGDLVIGGRCSGGGQFVATLTRCTSSGELL